jgi:hemoglobin-like flavoprotein
MTPEQKTLVRDSFAKVTPIAPAFAAMFYARLFELDPALRPLFRIDMKEQGRKLIAMIVTAVGNLDRLDDIVPAVRDLGKRHAGYGVLDAHYDTVANALLWTLDQRLGADFTSDTKAAWIACYSVLAGEMKAAAAG